MPVTLSCFAAEEKAGGELRLIGASGAPVLKLDGWRSIFGSCAARLGASLPGRLHQLLDCSCLQKHGLCWFCKVFEVQRQWRVCDVPPHAFALACAGSDSIATEGDNVFCAPEESVAVSCSGASDPIDKRM